MRCWFSGLPIDGDRRNWDKHHLICKRFFRRYPKEDPDLGNVVPALVEFHRRFHFEFDDPKWDIDTFMAKMEEIDFGRNIYAHEAQFAAD